MGNSMKYIHFIIKQIFTGEDKHFKIYLNVYMKLSHFEETDIFNVLERILIENGLVRVVIDDIHFIRAFYLGK